MGCPGLLAASALPAQPGAPCCARRSKSASGAKRCSAWPAPWTREASDCGACLFRLHAYRAARACIPGGRPAVCDAGAPVIHERGAAAPPEAAGPRRAVPYTLRHAWSPAPRGAQDQGLLEEAERHCLRLLDYGAPSKERAKALLREIRALHRAAAAGTPPPRSPTGGSDLDISPEPGSF